MMIGGDGAEKSRGSYQAVKEDKRMLKNAEEQRDRGEGLMSTC